MARYIDADALIAEYDRVHIGPAGGARKLMVDAPTVDVAPKSEWISVEDRLPDNYRAVLVVCEGTTIGCGTLTAIGSYGGGFWSLADADRTKYLTKYMHYIVTHWMPLPEAPKMKGGAE